jgi:hypothetical protein
MIFSLFLSMSKTMSTVHAPILEKKIITTTPHLHVSGLEIIPGGI